MEMKTGLRRLVPASLILLLTSAGLAQDTGTSSDHARVLVSVTDRSGGGRIAGLTAADFRVFADGRETTVASVAEGPGPVSVAVVLDSTDNMTGLPQQLAQQAVERMFAAFTPDDELTVLLYDEKITFAMPWTPGGGVLEMPWTRWKTARFSELLQGINQAVYAMERARNPRCAVVAISDATQVASRHPLRAFVQSRRQSEVAIYELRTSDFLSAPAGMPGPKPHGPLGTTNWDSRGALVSLDDLIRDSGGRMMPIRTADEVPRTVRELLTDLRHQYVVTFVAAKPADGTFRRLKVQVRNGAYKVRHRTEYLAEATTVGNPPTRHVN